MRPLMFLTVLGRRVTRIYRGVGAGLLLTWGNTMAWTAPCSFPLRGELPACEPPNNSTYIGTTPWYADELRNYEGNIRKRPVIVGRFTSMDPDALKEDLNAITFTLHRDPDRDATRTPYVPLLEVEVSDELTRGIVQGEASAEATIRQVAVTLKDYAARSGQQRIFWDPWFEWPHPGSQIDLPTLQAAWPRLHRSLANNGVTNLIWVWHIVPQPIGMLEQYLAVYPGDEYVDWWGASSFWLPDRGRGDDQFNQFLQAAQSHGKKVIMVEFGTSIENCFVVDARNGIGPPIGEVEDSPHRAWYEAWFQYIRSNPVSPGRIAAISLGNTNDCRTVELPWGDSRLNGTSLGAWMRDEFDGRHGSEHAYLAAASLTPLPPDFTLAVSPAGRIALRVGERASYRLTLRAPQALSAPVLPILVATQTITGVFTPASLRPTPNGTSGALTIQVGAQTAPGLYPIWVRVEQGYVTRMVHWKVDVQPGGPCVPGDANCDGTMNALDLQLCINAFRQTPKPEPYRTRCKFQGDGDLAQADLDALARLILRQ